MLKSFYYSIPYHARLCFFSAWNEKFWPRYIVRDSVQVDGEGGITLFGQLGFDVFGIVF